MGSIKTTFDDQLFLLEMSFVARGMGLVMLSEIIGNCWGLIRVFDLFRVIWSTCPLGPAKVGSWPRRKTIRRFRLISMTQGRTKQNVPPSVCSTVTCAVACSISNASISISPSLSISVLTACSIVKLSRSWLLSLSWWWFTIGLIEMICIPAFRGVPPNTPSGLISPINSPNPGFNLNRIPRLESGDGLWRITLTLPSSLTFVFFTTTGGGLGSSVSATRCSFFAISGDVVSKWWAPARSSFSD